MTEIAADHCVDRCGQIKRQHLVSDEPSIAHHDNAIGNAADIGKPVGNVGDADSSRAQLLDNLEQARGLRRRESGGRFVENDNGCVRRHGAPNRHKLAMRRAKLAEIAVQRHIKPDAGRDGLCL